MKMMAKFALILGLLAVGTTQVLAQETIEVQVQNVNVALTGFAQGGDGDNLTVERVRITSRDLIAATGEANTRGAKLLVVTPTEDPEASSSFVVRTGSGRNAVDTDVTGLFTGQTLLVVEKSTPSTRGRRGTQYSIDQFQFGFVGDEENPGTPVSFNVQGFTTTSLGNQNLTSNVNGTGNVNGADAVLRGTIKMSGAKTETLVVEVPQE